MKHISRLRNIHSNERNKNALTEDNKNQTNFVRKKFFRHHKKHSSREHRSEEKRFEVPEHEFEEKFEVKAPPKNVNKTEEQQFNNWFFRDTYDDLEAAESQYYNHTEVSKFPS